MHPANVDHLPENAQAAARELLNTWSEDVGSSSRYLCRLIAEKAPEMRRTWQRIDAGIGGGVFAVARWMKFFDLLVTLPLTVDQSFPEDYEGTTQELRAIADKAGDLATMIAGYWKRCEKHGIDCPAELDTLDHLIATVRDARSRSGENCWLWYQERCGYSSPHTLPDGREVGEYSRDNRPSHTLDNGRFGSEIARMLATLSDICKTHDPAILDPMTAATHGGNRAVVTPYVLNFDYRLKRYYCRSDVDQGFLPCDFAIGPTDLAQLLWVLLQGDLEEKELRQFTSKAVGAARRRHTGDNP